MRCTRMGKYYFMFHHHETFHDRRSFHIRLRIFHSGVSPMEENKLVALSLDFAVEIVALCDQVKGYAPLRNQLLRSGTSIGANIHEANYAHGKADFIAKLQIALKECYESEYWLTLFSRTNLISAETYQKVAGHCGTIRRILIASIKTAREHLDST